MDHVPIEIGFVFPHSWRTTAELCYRYEFSDYSTNGLISFRALFVKRIHVMVIKSICRTKKGLFTTGKNVNCLHVVFSGLHVYFENRCLLFWKWFLWKGAEKKWEKKHWMENTEWRTTWSQVHIIRRRNDNKFEWKWIISQST